MTDNPYENVPEEHIFHFRDGDQAHNLEDLRNVINDMSDDEFTHHVDPVNNDFANWVEFVYKKPEVAGDMRKVTTQKQTIEVLDAEIGKYSSNDMLAPEKPKQRHEDPITPTPPPQTIVTHDGEVEQHVSTVATHRFLVKEFFGGLILGLIAGFLLALAIGLVA